MGALSSPDGEVLGVAGELLPDVDFPRDYLERHLTALLGFYAGAARRRLAIVLWWD
jgi:hypothetical protein